MRSSLSRPTPVVVVIALMMTMMNLAASPAHAAPSFTSWGLNASVSGSTVTASVSLQASEDAVTREAGICVRNGAGENVDFDKRQYLRLDRSGTTVWFSDAFPAGTYTYWACVLDDGSWHDVGKTSSFTVRSGSGQAAGASSGTSMPRGDLNGWKQIFSEDFTTSQGEGRFPGVYADKWRSYDGFPDTTGRADYNHDIISVHDGALDMRVHVASNGRRQGAAPIPLLTADGGKVTGQTYGRYSVRFKADATPGFGLGWLLWPESGNWNEGEIDFPEGRLTGSINGYNHCLDDPSVNCAIVETGVPFGGGWHVTTLEWTPTRITFILDGKAYRTTNRSIPNDDLQWVLQTGSAGVYDASASGHVLIDWVSIYSWNGA